MRLQSVEHSNAMGHQRAGHLFAHVAVTMGRVNFMDKTATKLTGAAPDAGATRVRPV